jgi:hypothetical protein
MSALIRLFASVEDPRARNVRHRLSDLLVMMVAASLCGATSATEMALFAEERREALSRLIRYDEAPSHDTFSRVLRLVAPDRFAALLARLAERIGAGIAGEGGPAVVALDGKALKRAYDRGQAVPGRQPAGHGAQRGRGGARRRRSPRSERPDRHG